MCIELIQNVGFPLEFFQKILKPNLEKYDAVLMLREPKRELD